MIAAQEEVTAEDAALALLAEAGDGSMRDALSIMDQAIASAPVEAGQPVLSAAQIRDLMGSVPNAVFERLLEAVAAGQSDVLMEQLNVLVNAGHSPSSLARQMVRYLRNALMAKLGGEQTELLQISADERARAARTSLLFTEEELTRNLQIVLRTFDDLNYRQEQRFHLELGLLKLIHAQRLLPIEELLSSVASGAGARGAAAGSTGRAIPGTAQRTAAPARAVATSTPASPTPAPATSSPSPFAPSSGSGSGGWNAGPTVKQSAAAVPVAETVSSSAAIGAARVFDAPVGTAREASPFPATSEAPAYGSATLTEGALAKAPETAVGYVSASTSLGIEEMRNAVVAALANAGHASCSQLLGAGTWTLDGASLRIEAPGIGKKTIPLYVNAAAEKIMRQELQRLGGPGRFMVVPGAGTAKTTPSAATPGGSVQKAALEHPMVERARELFKAEVRSVVDLRQK
jgi:DNA polymerase-3 subunit gamma/tau